jgi:hypothetical protein
LECRICKCSAGLHRLEDTSALVVHLAHALAVKGQLCLHTGPLSAQLAFTLG